MRGSQSQKPSQNTKIQPRLTKLLPSHRSWRRLKKFWYAVFCILLLYPAPNLSRFPKHKTIDGVLERGVKLDQLVDKSNDLSNQSKMFYKQAKKTNACCVIA